MRDEDLAKLPRSIEGWRIAELLKGIGIERYDNVREILIEPRRIRVIVYATDENGRRYVEYAPEDVETVDLGEKEPGLISGRSVPTAAQHEISIPFVGSWEKPVPEPERCESRGPDGIRCHKGWTHGGQHQLGSVYWR